MDIMSPDKAKKPPEQELQEAWEMRALSGKGNPRFLQSKKFRFANSVERPELVIEWATRRRTNGRDFWRVVALEWSSFDRIDHYKFGILFSRYRPHWTTDVWAPDDFTFYASLPERLKVYRGQSADWEVGLSFTIDPTVAKSFAHGHRGIRLPNPVVLEVEINKADIAFATNEREESEVVLFQPPPLSFLSSK
jgi:hypothetical protein